LGLAGGIYLASSGLSGTFDAANAEKLRTALHQLLAGAGLAFTTSIVGLICSLIFSITEKHVIKILRNRLMDFVSAMDARVRLITTEYISRQQLSIQEKQKDLMQEFVDNVGQNISDAINGMFSQGMQPLIEKMIDELVLLRTDRATDATQVISQLSKDLAEKIHLTAGKEMEAFASAFSEMRSILLPLLGEYKELQDNGIQATTQLNSILGKFIDLQNSLEVEIKNINNCASTLESTFIKINDLLQSNLEYSKATLDDVKKHYELITEENGRQERRFEQHLLAMQEQYGDFEATWEKSIQAVEVQRNNIDATWSKYANAAQNHYVMLNSHHDNLEKNWVKYCERFENVDTSLENIFKSIDSGISAYSASTKEYVASLDAHLSDAASHLNSVVIGFREVMDEWSEWLDEWQAQQEKNVTSQESLSEN